MNTSPALSPQAIPAPVSPVADTVVAGRRLADYESLTQHPGHHHSIDTVVGYAVRETVRDGRAMWHGTPDERGNYPHCGVDVAVIEGSTRYSETFPIRDRYRCVEGGYAFTVELYACGCRG